MLITYKKFRSDHHNLDVRSTFEEKRGPNPDEPESSDNIHSPLPMSKKCCRIELEGGMSELTTSTLDANHIRSTSTRVKGEYFLLIRKKVPDGLPPKTDAKRVMCTTEETDVDNQRRC